MESLFIVLILISIVVLIVGLTKPEVIKLKSRKDVTLAGGGLIVFFFICAAIASPATQTPSTPVVTTTENSTPVATTSAPVTQAPVVTKKTVVTQPVVIAPVQATVPVVTPVVTPTPAQPVTLLDISGQGSKSTQNFTTPSDAWQVNYTYDCSNFGDKGNFQVYIYHSDGSMSFDNAGINQLGKSGADTEYYHTGGSYYLEVNSECNWTVQVKG